MTSRLQYTLFKRIRDPLKYEKQDLNKDGWHSIKAIKLEEVNYSFMNFIEFIAKINLSWIMNIAL
jgi:hypothetical protein